MKVIVFALGTVIALVSAAAAQVTNYETPGNLKPTHDLECLSMDQFKAEYTPADLMASLPKCSKAKRYDDAFFLFLTAQTYSYFDALRVPDPSAHDAFLALGMKYRPDAETLAHLKEGFAALGAPNSPVQAKLCAGILRLGPPNYRPDYMIAHGMGAFLGGVGGVEENFDTQKGWKKTLDYLGCQPQQP